MGERGEIAPSFLSKLKAHLQEHIDGALIEIRALGRTENPIKQPPANLKFKLLCFEPSKKKANQTNFKDKRPEIYHLRK